MSFCTGSGGSHIVESSWLEPGSEHLLVSLMMNCIFCYKETVNNGFLVTSLIRVGQKNVALYFCLYFHQLLIDFQNSFTGTLCRQFAITWLLHIPPHGSHHKCVSTLPCEISMKYAYIMIITNKHLLQLKKKHFRPTLGEVKFR